MPTYVYKFVKTGETIEVQQSFSDDSLTKYKHPETGRVMAVKKVFQPVGVTFKGSGFFKNDNRDKKSTTTPAADSSGDGASTKDSGGDSSSSSDTKVADTKKTDTKTSDSTKKSTTTAATSD